MRWPICISISAVLVIGMLRLALAEPSLPITNPPVASPGGLTGPIQDPAASQGQWLRSLSAGPGSPPLPGSDFSRTHEFYDNVPGSGGGPLGSLAIEGVVKNIVYNGAPGIGNIMSFNIEATIRNGPPPDSPWNPGANSHLEQLAYPQSSAGTLLGAQLTAEFAYGQNAPLPAQFLPPYADQPPRIRATNHESLAWYCWSPSDPQQPTGDFYVPAWDFGNIPEGASVTKTLSFVVDGLGLAPGWPGTPGGDIRYGVLRASELYGMDVLYNRTEDLKIGDWMDILLIDNGVPYGASSASWPWNPEDLPYYEVFAQGGSGNVSVFHSVPEPAMLAAMASGSLVLVGLWRYRRRVCKAPKPAAPEPFFEE